MMSFRLKALQFTLNTYLPSAREIKPLECTAGDRPCLLYTPRTESKPLATIVLINGYSVFGHRDERMARVGRALAAIGFEVYLPSFEGINQLKICPEIPGQIATFLSRLRTARGYPLALLTPSFTGGMALAALSEPGMSDVVSSVCCIGSYSSIESSVSHVIEKEKIDDYARNVLMKNFIELAIGRDEDILRGLDIAIADNGHKRKKALLPAYVRQMKKEKADLFLRLFCDADYRKNQLRRAYRILEAEGRLFRSLDVLDKADRIDSAVCLIHGSDDEVIPPSESEALYRKLRSLGKRAHLRITPLITHGDLRINWKIVKDVYDLTEAFSFFFEEAIRPLSEEGRYLIPAYRGNNKPLTPLR